MKITTQMTVNFGFTSEDIEVLERADEILDKLNEFANGNDDLMYVSQETGELIEVRELPRVRGVLSGLFQSRCWTLEPR